MRKLRYYAPDYTKEDHEKIIAMLEEIKKIHKIEWEEFPVEREEWYNRNPILSPREVYEKHLKPMTKIIKTNTKLTAYELFDGGEDVRGKVVVLDENGRVISSHLSTLEFLKEILEKGSSLLDSLSVEKSDIHDILFEKLKENNLPEPEIPKEEKKYIKGIVTGFRMLGMEVKDEDYNKEEVKKFGVKIITENWWNRLLSSIFHGKYGGLANFVLKADYMVISKNNVWILEGKENLNFEAIGQILTYKYMVEKDYPWLGKLKIGIVCMYGDEKLERVCKELGIEVFVFGKRKIATFYEFLGSESSI